MARGPFVNCPSNQPLSRGWVSPRRDGGLVFALDRQWLLALAVEQRLLPASVVIEEVKERAEAIEAQQGYAPGRKQLKELRERVTEELMPRAFTRRRSTFVWIDPQNGWLCVDASSPARAEEVIEHLRHCLDEFPLALLHTQVSPASAMADWLAGEAPEGFTIDQDFALQSIAEDRARATFKGHDLEAAHVIEHLEAGRLPIRLAMTFDDRLSFVLTDRGALKRIDFLDVIRDQVAVDEHEDAQALFDAEFALMTGELLRLLPAVVAAMGGELTRTPALIDNAKEQA